MEYELNFIILITILIKIDPRNPISLLFLKNIICSKSIITHNLNNNLTLFTIFSNFQRVQPPGPITTFISLKN